MLSAREGQKVKDMVACHMQKEATFCIEDPEAAPEAAVEVGDPETGGYPMPPRPTVAGTPEFYVPSLVPLFRRLFGEGLFSKGPFVSTSNKARP